MGPCKTILSVFIVATTLSIISPYGYGDSFSSMKIEALLSEAQRGNHQMQYLLASKYYDGAGIPVDYKKAFYWFNKAVESEPDSYTQVAP